MAKMKIEYDQRMKARESKIRVGQQVLVKWTRTRKSQPLWDPEPYMVTEVKGSMVTARFSVHN